MDREVMQPTAVRDVTRYRGGAAEEFGDTLVVEEPLEIRLNNERFSVTMRTPGDDFALVRGLLLTEGVIGSNADIGRLRYCEAAETDIGEENVVNVHVSTSCAAGRRWQRQLMSGTSCGLCGKEAIEAVSTGVTPLPGGLPFPHAVLQALPDELRRRQALFSATGGLHAAGLFTHTGECLVCCEDIGRHNATDKAIGHGVAEGWLPWGQEEGLALLISGRASFEIVQKALMAGIPIVCAVSAASALATDLAEANGQTLVGFLRDKAMTVYAGRARIGE